MLLHRLKIFAWSLKQLICAAPIESLLLVMLVMITGIVPGLSLYIIEHLINWVAYNQHGVQFPLSLILFWGGILLIDYASAPLISVVRIQLNEKILSYCNILLMQKANSFVGLEPFENTKYYDKVQFLREESRRKPLNFVYIIVGFFKDIISLFSIIIVLGTINAWIPFFVVLAAIPHAFSTMQFEKQSWDQILFQSPQARRMSWLSSISLDGKVAHEMRLFGFGDYFIQSYRKLAKSFQDQFRIQRLKQCMLSISFSFLTTMGYLAIFSWILIKTVDGHMEVGSVAMALQALLMMQSQLTSFMQNLAMLIPVFSYFEHLKDFLGDQFVTDLKMNPDAKKFEKFENQIRFENVSFTYPDGRKALANLSVVIRPNDKIAIVGENGAGKSTFIKLLMRMYDPTEGRITVDNTDLRDLDLSSWRACISAVFQDFGKYHLSVQENIGIGAPNDLQSKEKIHIAAKKSGFGEVLEKLPQNLDTLLGKEFGGTSLSGGEWQKLAMSRALIKNAGVLIFDEPNAALDPKSEHEIFENFSVNSDNRTTLFITHRLGLVLMSNRIIVMHEGQIIEQGSHEDLMKTKGHYQDLFMKQASRYAFTS